MAKIIDMADERKKMRDQMAEEIVQVDRNPVSDIEADRLLKSFASEQGRRRRGCPLLALNGPEACR